jgi:hypothetical protein
MFSSGDQAMALNSASQEIDQLSVRDHEAEVHKNCIDTIKLWHDQAKHIATISGVALAAFLAFFYNDHNHNLVETVWYVPLALLGVMFLIGSLVVAMIVSHMIASVPLADNTEWPCRLKNARNVYNWSLISLIVGGSLAVLFILASVRLGG